MLKNLSIATSATPSATLMPPHNQQKINILTILVAKVAEENEKHSYAHARDRKLKAIYTY